MLAQALVATPSAQLAGARWASPAHRWRGIPISSQQSGSPQRLATAAAIARAALAATCAAA
eukprot:8400703-Alexandrium_andersonii.AAC.1